MTVGLTSLMLALGPAAVLLVMAVVFAETGLLLGFFLPGDTLLFTTGLLVAAGVVGLPFWLVALGVGAAAIAGDQVGYSIGRRFGPSLLNHPRSRWLSPRHVARAMVFFDDHGPKAVILARFVAVLRTFTPLAAGLVRMPRTRFTTYNVIGAVTWTLGLLAGGFFLGGVTLVAAHVELSVLTLVALSLVPVVIALLRRRHFSSVRANDDLRQAKPAPQLELVG